MLTKKEAFNITILILQPESMKLMRPVRSLDMFDGATDQFHPDGLFSTLTFGKLGDPMRKLRFSYIDIKVSIIHPIVYKALGEVKQLYVELMQGTAYAVWDAVTKDLIKTDPTKGRTGYAFFLEYLPKLKFEDRPSLDRKENIALIEKWRNNCLIDKIVVLPAGYRDVVFEETGRTSEDEINTFYRSFLGVANTIVGNPLTSNPELMDGTRVSLQRKFIELYDNIIARIDGKHKLMMGKVASRRVFNGTRNVLTALDAGIEYLGGPGETDFNHSYMGIYQTAVALLPLATNALMNKYLPLIFTSTSAPAKLVDKKTLKKVDVNLSATDYNTWMTVDGLSKVIHSFGLAGTGLDGASVNDSIHNKPFELAGHYMGLIFKGPDQSFKFFQDIDELPSTYNRDDVSPITFTEFMYCSLYGALNNMPVLLTRYPITGIGSVYPSRVKMQSTVKFERRWELQEHWQRTADIKNYAVCFPTKNSALYQSLSPNPAKLAGLTADFDGDTGSANALYSANAVNEIEEFLGSVNAYVGTDGKFMASVDINTSTLLFHNLSRGVN